MSTQQPTQVENVLNTAEAGRLWNESGTALALLTGGLLGEKGTRSPHGLAPARIQTLGPGHVDCSEIFAPKLP